MSIDERWPWRVVPAELEECLGSEMHRRVFRMLREGLNYNQIGSKEGVASRNVASRVAVIKERLREHNFDPNNPTHPITPPPLMLTGKSTLSKLNEDGSKTPVMVWDKVNLRKQAQHKAFAEAIDELAEGIKPFKAVAAPAKRRADLLTVYTLTDFHLGMYAWAEETGANWDMATAENVLLNAVAAMIEGSPDAEAGIFAQMGDLLHWDGLLALTPTAKNVVDADTRFALLVQTAIAVCIKAVEMLLHKHKSVHVLMAEGNHDIASSVWLRAVMANAFRKNKRVTVDTSPFPFYFYRWGGTFLGWHHGHLQKMDNLPLMFATDPKFKRDYGQCDFTYIHTGHMHHQRVIDKGGIVVEQHPTLAARDAHGARGFLYSNRETKAITYHKESGEVSRVTVRPDLRKFGV